MTGPGPGAADFERLSALHAAAFAGHGRGWTAAEIAALAARGRLFEAADGAGFALVSLAADEAELLTLAVAPDRRRRGLGAGLMRRMLADLPAAGAGRLFLEVAADNAPALALYRRFDFAETGRRRAYYRRPGGAVDALTFARALP